MLLLGSKVNGIRIGGRCSDGLGFRDLGCDRTEM